MAKDAKDKQKSTVLTKVKALVLDPSHAWVAAILLTLFEIAFTLVIIKKVAYTEIDWRAYMQEVEGFLSGERDYYNLKGDTGPLVYPGGFVYIYVFLRWATDNGTNILKGQYIFAALYVINQAVVFAICCKTRKVPPWALCLLVLSKRVHSLFVLRLFNDCIAMLFFYIAVFIFMHRRWTLGCVWFSLAVSVKMNVLLAAPALLWLLLVQGGWAGAIKNISVCAMVQLVLGAPFLLHNPIAYVHKSFELGRVFFFKWTVNWKFLPEELFLSSKWALLLLACHLIALAMLCRRHCRLSDITKDNSSPTYIAVLLFGSNFAGIVFARTLHYQFYSWYFHTLPLLMWHTEIPVIARILIMIATEVAFNVFPATPWSSAMLTASNLLVLAALLTASRWYTSLTKSKSS